ncbi:MAG: 2Fe-2S iron-sulfur cluster binding domain-containing protein [Flavobacteriales bacterium]|nr:2Fe-2S iron-sulfur cluster binding domain-containing protein [Flavobacteriales bacterium]
MDDLIKIYVTDLDGVKHCIEAPTDMGLSLMEAIKANELQIKATCGGMALCATCHVYIKSDHLLPTMSEDEEAMLDDAFLLGIPHSRLSCQIYLKPELDGLEVQLGENTAV